MIKLGIGNYALVLVEIIFQNNNQSKRRPLPLADRYPVPLTASCFIHIHAPHTLHTRSTYAPLSPSNLILFFFFSISRCPVPAAYPPPLSLSLSSTISRCPVRPLAYRYAAGPDGESAWLQRRLRYAHYRLASAMSVPSLLSVTGTLQ